MEAGIRAREEGELTLSNYPATELRCTFPDIAFALETTALQFEIENELYLESCIRTWEKGAELTFQLSGSYELVIQPMVKSYGGYPVWGTPLTFKDPDTGRTSERYILHVLCSLRKGPMASPEFQVEIKASSLERVIGKTLAQIQRHCNKRLVPLPIETIKNNN
jgi:hypothetical protein